MTEAIIEGISGSDDIYGGDLSIVVNFLEPTLKKYNRDHEAVFGLTQNMYNISNTLVASVQSWTELTDFRQRYLLSSNILSNIDKTGFLFLAENLFSNFTITKPFNITTQFSFKYVDVILDTIDPEGEFPHCYDFHQVRLKHFQNQIFSQGSICVPKEALNATDGLGNGVATSLEFYNGDDLLFPSFHYEPESNLSSIIGFSLDNNAKVELSRNAEPVRITFKQVTLIFKLLS